MAVAQESLEILAIGTVDFTTISASGDSRLFPGIAIILISGFWVVLAAIRSG